MPAFSTHYIFAYEMMEKLEKISDFQLNKPAVYYGTQGPDIFFFHRVMPWMCGKSLRACGSELHRSKPELILEAMRSYCEKNGSDIAKSYVFGFILHYALDRRCHPYVYFLQNKITDGNRLINPHTAHNNIEFAMDSLLLCTHMGVDRPETFDTAKTIIDDNNVIEEIARLLEYAVSKTIGTKITASQVETALRDLKYIQKISLDAHYLKHMLIAPIELLIAPLSHNFKFTSMMRIRDLEKAKKYANIYNRIWKSPYSLKSSNQSFEDLFEEAKTDAEKMLSEFQAGKACGEITENLSFLTGVEVK